MTGALPEEVERLIRQRLKARGVAGAVREDAQQAARAAAVKALPGWSNERGPLATFLYKHVDGAIVDTLNAATDVLTADAATLVQDAAVIDPYTDEVQVDSQETEHIDHAERCDDVAAGTRPVRSRVDRMVYGSSKQLRDLTPAERLAEKARAGMAKEFAKLWLVGVPVSTWLAVKGKHRQYILRGARNGDYTGERIYQAWRLKQEGRTQEQIAKALGIKRDRVRTMLDLAEKRMAAMLDVYMKDWGDHPANVAAELVERVEREHERFRGMAPRAAPAPVMKPYQSYLGKRFVRHVACDVPKVPPMPLTAPSARKPLNLKRNKK